MVSNNISIPRGTRDFMPYEVICRQYIFDIIRNNFTLFGFMPVETPSIEYLSTLLGKYGDEGDKLIFKILNSGNFTENINDKNIFDNPKELSAYISEKGLRYDLTVPFARFVVMNRNNITFPFKRYQIQNVWRADRPQKGRYREFTQCDCDVIGSNSIINEVELIQIIDKIFTELGIKVNIVINNRKILNGIAEITGETENFGVITNALDKIDKIGKDRARQEMLDNNIKQTAVDKIFEVIECADNSTTVKKLKIMFETSENGKKGVEEIEEIFEYIKNLEINNNIVFDTSLARGLSYYTGTIFEVRAADVNIGSICGGGRYDNLTDIFGLKNVSGVGISFGADRIYDVLKELKLLPDQNIGSTQIMFVNFGKTEAEYCLKQIEILRKNNIRAEIYPDAGKLKKQMDYANSKTIAYVALVGSNEIENGQIVLKDMKSGEQITILASELLNKIVIK